MLTMVSSKNTDAGSYGSVYGEPGAAPAAETSSDSNFNLATVRS